MSDIPDDIMKEARKLAGWATYERQIEAIAEALQAAEKRGEQRELERWKPAVIYFERYCQDEADDDAIEWAGCSEQQHIDAKAFAAAIRNT